VFSPTDTIVAIATASGRAGIGVVRIGGPRAHGVARSILTVSHDLAPRYATLTHVRGTGVGDSDPRVPPAFAGADSPPGYGATPLPNRPINEVVATFFPAPPAFAGADSPPGYGTTPPPNRPIDEVVATFFPAPHSYTAEDVVEICAHGSMALLGEIVRAAIGAGARLAEPGEFTLRAFLNGRLDLVQAEAVADLVDAVTPLQARVAFDQLEGTLTRAIGALDRELFDLAVRLEASVDFPDEGYHFVAAGEAAAALGRVRDGIDTLLATSASGRVIREGRHIAILGKPNVGKSSLFNQLVGTDRAIVAAGPGTTRDMLRETIDLDGIRLGLIDTAGIRASNDEVEREGVTRARGAAGVADLVVLVLDRSRPLEEVDRALLQEPAAAARVVVVNKIDLAPAWRAEELGQFVRDAEGQKQEASSKRPEEGQDPPPFRGVGVVDSAASPASRRVAETASICPPFDRLRASRACRGAQGGQAKVTRGQMETARTGPAAALVLLSLKTGAGLDKLRAAMRDALDVAEPLRDAPMVTNVRHEGLLREAREAIARAIASLEEAGESASEELVLADLSDARGAFEEVTGKRTTEDLLRRIFEKFCVGK
jgi:tRNA modification GTPase TrmE